ncbi:MAG: Hsp70 family protein [Acidimicrobiales bacterium]
MGYALGIDLGTTFTAAAVARGERVEIVGLGNHTSAIPTAVLLRDDGTLLVGDAAIRRGQLEPARLAREFKRRLGDATPIILGHTPYSAERLMAAVVRDVVDAVSERQGGRPTAVVIAHPANWGPYKRELLEQAAVVAGLHGASFVTEPEAAAIHFASGERVDEGGIVAVYDLGGGTFDAAVLKRVGDRFVTMGQPQGIERLGGIDLDESVMSHIRTTLGDAFANLDGSDPAVRSAMIRLRDDAVGAKEALSADSETVIQVMLPGLQTQIRLTRPEFESMIRPVLRETVEMLKRALDVAGVAPAGLSAVVLAGGSSRIPLVAEMVSAAIGRPVSVDAHPKDTVALGAARLAASAERATSQPTPVAPAIPTPDAPVPPPAVATATPPVTPATATPPTAAPPPRRTAPPEPARAPSTVKQPRRGRKREMVAAGVIFAAAIGIGAFALANRDGGATGPEGTEPETGETSATGRDCTAASGRCAFITNVALDGDTVVVRYETVGYEPHLDAGPDSKHVHFYFDTVPVTEAGIPANGPWVAWGLGKANGEYVYSFRAADIPAGAGRLCASVANVNHGLDDHEQDCVALPGT